MVCMYVGLLMGLQVPAEARGVESHLSWAYRYSELNSAFREAVCTLSQSHFSSPN